MRLDRAIIGFSLSLIIAFSFVIAVPYAEGTTYVFNDGFESGNYAAWYSTPTSGAGSTIAVDNTVSANGTYSSKSTITTTTGAAYALGNANASSLSVASDIWSLMYFRTDTIPANTYKQTFFQLSNSSTVASSSTCIITVGLYATSLSQTDLELKICNPAKGSQFLDFGGFNIHTNSFQRVETHIFKHATAGYIEVYLNGSLAGGIYNQKTDYSAYDVKSYAAGEVSTSGSVAVTFHVWVDSVSIHTERIGSVCCTTTLTTTTTTTSTTTETTTLTTTATVTTTLISTSTVTNTVTSTLTLTETVNRTLTETSTITSFSTVTSTLTTTKTVTSAAQYVIESDNGSNWWLWIIVAAVIAAGLGVAVALAAKSP